MARYTGPKTKIARKFGEPIFGKIKVWKKEIILLANMVAQREEEKSEYAIQLMEKQKAKYTYGILEKQLEIFLRRQAEVKE